MYYEDLSPCDYFDESWTSVFAVGWLEPPHDFPRGPVPDAFVSRLEELQAEDWDYWGFKGGQWCGFCGVAESYSFRNLFIPTDGKVLVAPEGIIHYIRVHEYKPPEVFINAVLDCPPQDSLEFFEEVARSGILEAPPEDVRAKYLERRRLLRRRKGRFRLFWEWWAS